MKNLIYKILEFLFKNGKKVTISGINLNLPFRFHRYYEHDYESENIAFFKYTVKSNDTVIDIGAQIGLMTKLFADLVGPKGKVYSFEPTPNTYKVLRNTIHINNIENNVIPIQKAVSDKKGKATFNISDVDIDAANSLTDLKRSTGTSGIEVDVISVDDFLEENKINKVDFIKVDAEGAEYYVLLGAKKTIDTYHPIINLALHPAAINSFNSSLNQIYDFVIAANYTIQYRSEIINEQDFVSKTNLFDVQLIPNNN